MLKPFELPLLSDFDRRTFQEFVPHDHYLRRVKSLVDFQRLRAFCTDAYDVGFGRPAVEPVLMIKILFLCFHYRLSDGQVIERCKHDIAFRYFLDLPAGAGLPHDTNGTHFRQRLGDERFEMIFQDLVSQLREQGFVRDRLRLKDATHLYGNVADPRPIELAGQVRERLLVAAKPFFADWVAQQRVLIDNQRLATAELNDQERLLARIAWLRKMTGALLDLRPTLPTPASLPDLKQDRLDSALDVAGKFLMDCLYRQVTGEKAPDRLVSGVDEDTRIGKHGAFYVGYMFDMSMDADSEFITAINVLAANGAEAKDAVDLIRQEESAQGNDVEGISIDGAGYNGPVLRELSDPAGLDLDVTVPPPETKPRAKFGPERFSLTVLGQLECPAGQTTTNREKMPEGFKYHFQAKQCAGCAMRGECLEKPESPKSHRAVIKNEYSKEYEKVQAKAKTPEYAQTRRTHSKVERKLGEVVRYHGRRCRYRGLGRVRSQGFLMALAVNVKRWVKLMYSKKAGELAGTKTVRAELATAS